jgi:NNP family nitrate/nitrite transporter-like MFS transporter
MLVRLRLVQIRWTRTWAEKGGRARPAAEAADSAAASYSITR